MNCASGLPGRRWPWRSRRYSACFLPKSFSISCLPLIQPVLAANATLQTLKPTEGLETYFKVALMSGAIIAMPVILVQFWLFISPGTTQQERRYIYIFVPSALFLFLLGIAFAWFILAPAAIFFLANFMTEIFKTDWTGQEYISFVMRLVFWMGVAFELPIAAYFVARIGVITSQNLRDQWRIAIVGIAILAAIITPSIDPVTMLLTMAPLFVLYILSIGLALIGQRQYERCYGDLGVLAAWVRGFFAPKTPLRMTLGVSLLRRVR